MTVLATLLLLAFGPSQTNAPCSFYAYSTDTDPTGLRVRAGPNRAAKEIGRLPAAVSSRKTDSYAPEFDVIASRDGWLQIRNANDYYHPGRRRPIFKGTGWISGSKVTIAIQSGIGHTGPGASTPILVDLGDWMSDVSGQVLAVTGCSGKWAKVRYTVPERQPIKGPHVGEAWFAGICGNQRTTCEQQDSEPGAPGGHRPGQR